MGIGTPIEIDHEAIELLPLVGAALRGSPLGHCLAVYVNRRAQLVVAARTGIRGIAPEHESVVAGMVRRIIEEADARA